MRHARSADDRAQRVGAVLPAATRGSVELHPSWLSLPCHGFPPPASRRSSHFLTGAWWVMSRAARLFRRFRPGPSSVAQVLAAGPFIGRIHRHGNIRGHARHLTQAVPLKRTGLLSFLL